MNGNFVLQPVQIRALSSWEISAEGLNGQRRMKRK